MKGLTVFLVITRSILGLGFTNAQVVYDTTKVAGWQVLVPETKPIWRLLSFYPLQDAKRQQPAPECQRHGRD